MAALPPSLVLRPVHSEGAKPLYINYTVGGRGYSRLANTQETQDIKAVFDKAIGSLVSDDGGSANWEVDNVSFNSHTITLINQNSETRLFSAGSDETHRDVYRQLLEGLAEVSSGTEGSQTFSGINPPADYGRWMDLKRKQDRLSTPIGSSFGVVGDLFRRGRPGLTMEKLGPPEQQGALKTAREDAFTAFLAKTEQSRGNLQNRNERLNLATTFETEELGVLKTARGSLTWQDKKPTDDQLKLEAASRAGQFLLWLSATNELSSAIEDRIDFYANRKEPITGLDVLTALDADIGKIPLPLAEMPDLQEVRNAESLHDASEEEGFSIPLGSNGGDSERSSFSERSSLVSSIASIDSLQESEVGDWDGDSMRGLFNM